MLLLQRNRPANKLLPHRPVLESDEQTSRFAGIGLLFCYNRHSFCYLGEVFIATVGSNGSILVGIGDVFCWKPGTVFDFCYYQ